MRGKLQRSRGGSSRLQRADCAKVGAAKSCCRIAKVCVIEGVEGLKAELDALLLMKRNPLEQR